MKSTHNYPVYQAACGWNALLPKREPQYKAPNQSHFDVIVVGAGVTGLAAARRIAELNPQAEIAVIEASTCGEGSSGRNSGFLINLPHNTSVSGHGSAQNSMALKQIAIYNQGLTWLKSIIDTHHIDCGWNEVGKYHAAATPRGEKNLRSALKNYEQWGVEYRELNRKQLQEELGTSYYQYGYHSYSNVFVQPAALVRGLADTLPANVFLWEGTPVLGLEKGQPYKVKTSKKELTAAQVVIANNGFARKLGFAKDRVLTIYTYAGLTEELDEDTLQQFGPAPEWGVIPANRLGTTLRKTAFKRFMVRSAYSYEKEQSLGKVKVLLEQCYKNRYPHLKSHELPLVWGGVTALTRNGALYFGEVDQNLFISIGCNGAGMLKGSIFGKLLGEMAVGQQSPALSDALGFTRPEWLPPEPIRKIAVTSMIYYQKIRAGLER